MANQFLIKNKMVDLRELSASEVASLQGETPTYAGVELLGYYEKGDTSASIIYYPSTTLDPDDGGSIIKIGDLSLIHKFSEVDVRYYGISGTGDETDRLQKILDLHSVVVIDSLEINIRAHDVNRPPSTEGFTYLIDKGGVSLNNNQHFRIITKLLCLAYFLNPSNSTGLSLVLLQLFAFTLNFLLVGY